ncbi:hypothetical protein GCM10010517_81830 [Streptosporangium fragile]|uniref:Uncharacterized protein n=1 Tax=Streptosporangium fragile TaxID=46186 RepID=A0ABP6J033_9ACTN
MNRLSLKAWLSFRLTPKGQAPGISSRPRSITLHGLSSDPRPPPSGYAKSTPGHPRRTTMKPAAESARPAEGGEVMDKRLLGK